MENVTIPGATCLMTKVLSSAAVEADRAALMSPSEISGWDDPPDEMGA